MIQIRQNTFETNSSSTHSIVICSRKQFEDWKAGKCFFNKNSETFTAPDPNIIEQFRKEAIEQYKQTHDNDPYSVSWDDLADEHKEKYIDARVKYKVQEHTNSYANMTYEGYKYSNSSLEYTEKFFTTEHGDQVVAFGCGGYDG